MRIFRWSGWLGFLVISLFTAEAFGNADELFNLPREASIQGEWQVVEGEIPLHFSRRGTDPSDPTPVVYVSSSEGGDGAWNDNRTGVLRSPSFLVTDQFYEAIVSGGNKYDSAYLSFRDAETDREYWRLTGYQSTNFDTRYLDLREAIGSRVRIDLVDRATGHWAHIRFGGLRIADQESARAQLVKEHLNLLKWREPRGAATHWLKVNCQKQHIDSVNEFLGTGNREQRFAIIWVLRHTRIANQKTVEILHELIGTGDEMLVSYALLLLAECRDLEVDTAAIVELMKNGPTGRIRREAMNALGRLRNEEGLIALKEWLLREKENLGHLQYVIDSRQFTRTEFPAITPGTVARGWLDGMEFWVYLPPTWTPDRKWPVVSIIHGTWGSGATYYKALREDADRLGFVVFAPTFDSANWWDFGKFGILCSSPRSDRQFWRILDGLAERLSLDVSEITLYGHSEGGQFVNRIALTYPRRVRRAASSGTVQVAWPDNSLEFPLGTGASRFAPDLAPDPAALMSGKYRLVMGEAEGPEKVRIVQDYRTACRRYAEENGTTDGMFVLINPGVGHSGFGNYPAIRDWLLEGIR